MSRLLRPHLNPLQMHEMNAVQIEQYVSRHVDDYFYMETVPDWQTKKEYYQPWQLSDTIPLQYMSDYSPLHLQLVDVDERVWWAKNMTALVPNYDDPTLFIYEKGIPLAGVPEGIYFVKLLAGPGPHRTLISEPLKVLAHQKNTLLLQYRHSEYYQDVAFETGFSPAIRIRATLSGKSLSGKASFFEDQSQNPRQTDGNPFETYELVVGGASGIPWWFAKKLNRILNCDTLLFDGRQFTQFDGSKWEPATQANYPMAAWSIELRESDNSSSVKHVDDVTLRAPVTIVVASNSKGFLMNDSGSSDTQMIDVF